MGAHSQRRLDVSVAHELRDVDGLDPRRDAQVGEVRLPAAALEVVAESNPDQDSEGGRGSQLNNAAPWHQPALSFRIIAGHVPRSYVGADTFPA